MTPGVPLPPDERHNSVAEGSELRIAHVVLGVVAGIAVSWPAFALGPLALPLLALVVVWAVREAAWPLGLAGFFIGVGSGVGGLVVLSFTPGDATPKLASALGLVIVGGALAAVALRRDAPDPESPPILDDGLPVVVRANALQVGIARNLVRPGEALRGVFDLYWFGTGVVVVTSDRVVIFDRGWILRRRSVTSIPLARISAIASVDLGRSWLGARSDLVCDTGGDRKRFPLRGGRTAEAAQDLLTTLLIESPR